jgi:type II secretory pathway pseudopilin PulG
MVSTPMSGTGRAAPGFTLLEVLGIIVLLGLACTLVYPNYINGEEKTRVQYIGKLLTSDIQQVQETAVIERDSASVVLAGDGYHYDLGGNQITRTFPKYGFTFKMMMESSEGDAAVTMENEGVLTFEANGSCNAMDLSWQSNHFRGSLQVAADGTVSWQYETRKQ